MCVLLVCPKDGEEKPKRENRQSDRKESISLYSQNLTFIPLPGTLPQFPVTNLSVSADPLLAIFICSLKMLTV